MAHTKAIGTTRLGRDSQPKYLGVKLTDGQLAKIGNIIVRQRGSRYMPGDGVRKGSDDTLYAVANGRVKFSTVKKEKFDGNSKFLKVVSVVSK